MTLATAVQRYLNHSKIPYHVSHHLRTRTLEEAAYDIKIDYHHIVRGVLLHDKSGIVMLVLPADHRIDFPKVHEQFGRNLQVLSSRDTNQLFKDCEPGCRPPLPEAYGFEYGIDEAIFQLSKDVIYFEPGTHSSMVGINKMDFAYLLSRGIRGNFSFSQLEQSGVGEQKDRVHEPSIEILRLQEYMGSLYTLPQKPVEIEPLLGLVYNDSDMTSEQSVAFLSEYFSRDLNFNNCLIHYANYRSKSEDLGDVDSIEDAILSLGTDVSAAFALALCLMRMLQVPMDGRFGLYQMCRHAIYSAAMGLLLFDEYGEAFMVDKGKLILSLLLQNTGILLLAQLFRPEFRFLNRLAELEPTKGIDILEKRTLGMGHAQQVMTLGHEQVGALFLELWGFESPITTVARVHHQEYSGDFSQYVYLCKICNYWLGKRGVGDSLYWPELGHLYSVFSLDHNKIEACANDLLFQQEVLDDLLESALIHV